MEQRRMILKSLKVISRITKIEVSTLLNFIDEEMERNKINN